MATQTGGSAASNTSNKRKRGPGDQEGGPTIKVQNTNTSTNGDTDANYSLLLQGDAILSDDNTRTAQAALAAPGMDASAYPEPGSNHGDTSLAFSFEDGSPTVAAMTTSQALGAPRNSADLNNQGNKPAVGSTEWHQVRKDNHKEVERRRREVINEGIENIGKIVPGTEKNKGAILQRTHEYIQELLVEKSRFEAERATLDIALKELTRRMERMREATQTAWAESKKWQSRCREAGLDFDDYDDGAFPSLEEDDVVASL